MASTLTTFDFAMKERYTDDKVESLMFSSRPLFGRIAKDETLMGDQFIQPLIRTAPQGLTGTIANIATPVGGTGGNVGGEKFVIPTGEYHAWVEIGDKVLKASRANPGAFLENKAAEIDNLYEQASDALALYAYSNGGFASGQRASAAVNVITLSSKDDVANFEVGMYVEASSADGASTLDALRVGSTFVTAVDRENGTVTLSSAAAIAAFADGDYLFRYGDFAGNTAVVIYKGLRAWISDTSAPAALYGVTRTTDVQRLSGSRLVSADYTGFNIEERLQKLITRMTGRYRGPGPDDVYMHPEDFQTLALSLQTRGERTLTDDSTDFGYNYLNVMAGGVSSKVFADRFCPQGTAFALRMNTWKIRSMLKLLHTLNGDGLTMLRKAATNDYQYRLVSYPLISCTAPGWNGRVPLT